MPDHHRDGSKKGSKTTIRNTVAAIIMIVALGSLYLLYSHVEKETLLESKLALENKAAREHIHIDIQPRTAKKAPPNNNNIESDRPRIAYAITMTGDGPFADGAAVLAYSILKISKGKDYDVSLVAFVHPEVKIARPLLVKLGYHVIECPTPINTTAIKFEFLREKINKNGCCGAKELIKLNAYRLLQYDRVVHIDADTYFLHAIDELLITNFSLIYTTDPNMATYNKKPEHFPVQGGFVVLQPSVEDYLGIINVMLTTEFKIHIGWNSSQIGWYWGGMTFQGVLPYYYYRISDPSRTQIVDRCIYNTMADTVACSNQTVDEIKSAHFTICQKPWTCYPHRTRLCDDLRRGWFAMRKEAETFYGISTAIEGCVDHRYNPMRLDEAKLPKNSSFVPDDSPDRMLPIGNNGFLQQQF